jgi:hypothetical protein
VALPGAARAAGDLLVAPTRVVLSGGGASEVILSNIGTEPATYRISLELRRMSPEGDLDEVAPEAVTDAEKAALAMVRYAPRRLTLQPNQPQSIRVSARPGAELPDGEYRVHLLFRAIPDAADAAKEIEQPAEGGLSIRLTPIYGITIPMIVRKGQLQVTAAIANPRVDKQDGASFLKLDLQRSGARSVYGDITIAPRGSKPVYAAKGLAVYPELSTRTVALQLDADEAAKLHGPMRIEYREPAEAGGKLIAALDANLP